MFQFNVFSDNLILHFESEKHICQGKKLVGGYIFYMTKISFLKARLFLAFIAQTSKVCFLLVNQKLETAIDVLWPYRFMINCHIAECVI